jgi:hypothetical protein
MINHLSKFIVNVETGEELVKWQEIDKKPKKQSKVIKLHKLINHGQLVKLLATNPD